MKALFIIIVNIILAVQIALSQSSLELKETFYTAEDFFFYEEYEEAIKEYNILQQELPGNSNILYKLGVCYLYLKNDINKAISFLLKASQNINPAYQEGYFKEEGAPPDVYLYLGNAYHLIDSLEIAEIYYRKFKNSLDPYDIAGVDFASHLLKTIKNAKELTQSPVIFAANDLKNQPHEYAENCYYILSGDNSTKIYFYTINGLSQIYFSKNNHPSLNKPQIIDHLSNSEMPIYVSSLSFNGNDLYLSKAEKSDRDIYICSFNDNSWGNPVKLNKNINTRSDENHACITKDGSALYFTSNRKKGIGGLDIYVSYKDINGEWDKPVLLGNSINTEYNEETPFLSPDGQTLYFSSEGHNSMGGYDIFYSILDTKEKWTKPINLGYPLNTADNDLYYFPGKNINEGYFSVKVEGALNKKKIVEIDFTPEETTLANIINDELITGESANEAPLKNDKETVQLKSEPTLNASVSDKTPDKQIVKQVTINGVVKLQDGKYNLTKIIVEIRNTNEAVIEHKTITNPEGKFTCILAPGLYSIKTLADGYGTNNQSISIPASYQPSEMSFETELIPEKIVKGDYLAIKNIFFNFDSYRLTYDAIVELERIANYMLRNSSVNAEVVGHTDAIGREQYNEQLSCKRAYAVSNYFTTKGINKKRLLIKFKGESQQIAINTNPDGSDNPVGRRYNRRVEVLLKNADKSIEIDDNLFIPEYLRAKEDNLYTILVSVGLNIPDTLNIKKITDNKLKIKKYEIRQTKIITLGESGSKASLAPILNDLIDAGYNEAKIINIQEINTIIRPFTKTTSAFDSPIYTIQLLTVKKPVSKSYFYGLKPITVSKGDDGYYRYTYKEFFNYNEAQKTLKKLKECCQKDAFIRKVEEIPNYDEE